MKLEDYSKYYIQGSDHYLVSKGVFVELFNEMINWKQENAELKKQLEKKMKAISFFESEEFIKSCKVLTEKLDNTGEYGHWLIVREYIDCVKERLR